MLFDKINESFDRLRLGDVEFHRLFANVEIDFVRCAADVAEVRICHFSWAINDASHDGDTHALEVACGGADFLGGFL